MVKEAAAKYAAEKKIPLQLDLVQGYGDDSAELQKSVGGVPTINMVVPVRYTHAHNGVMNRRVGEFDLTPEPTVHDLGEIWLLANETLVPDASRFYRSRPNNFRNPLMTKEGAPSVAFRWMEVEGPLYDEDGNELRMKMGSAGVGSDSWTGAMGIHFNMGAYQPRLHALIKRAAIASLPTQVAAY